MTWEEIIIQIRKDPQYKDLVEKAYFEEDLALNVERFRASEEFEETLKVIQTFIGRASGLKLLDLGAGNGVASLAFALNDFDVTAAEPDPSETIGSGAIRRLEKQFCTGRVQVSESFGEKLPFPDNAFDIVYVRQAMHHAHDLSTFIKEAARVLKKGGLLCTVRDHVIYDAKDKALFLENHPLHRFYGGENAFTFNEYKNAILHAGLKIEQIYRHYDTVINYFPEKRETIEAIRFKREKMIDEGLKRKLPGPLSKTTWIRQLYRLRLEKKIGPALDEKIIPGRHISFFARK